jgi:hypothetical protein
MIPEIKMRLAGYLARMEENGGAYILVGKPEGKETTWKTYAWMIGCY